MLRLDCFSRLLIVPVALIAVSCGKDEPPPSDTEATGAELLTADETDRTAPTIEMPDDPAPATPAVDENVAEVPERNVILPTSAESPQTWRYTFRDPGGLWMRKDYDDREWRESQGIFGDDTAKQSFADRGWKVNTEWTRDRVWLRKTFEAGDLSPDEIDRLVLRAIHDDDLRVYINGIYALDEPGSRNQYAHFAITKQAKQSITPNGPNLIAVTCTDRGGEQQVDVGLLVGEPDADE